MRIRTQKKLTCMVWGITTLASMIVLADGACGMDTWRRQYGILQEEKKVLEQEVQQQKEIIELTAVELKSETGGAGDTPVQVQIQEVRKRIDPNATNLQEALTSINQNLIGVPGDTIVGKVAALQTKLILTEEAKESLREQHTQVRDLLQEIKATTGGSGSNTPLPIRFKKSETKALLLEQERQQLKETLQTVQVELVETNTHNLDLSQQYVESVGKLDNIKAEIGEGGTPPVHQVRKLSNSLKKHTSNLTEAVNALDQKLQEIPGEDCVSKVGILMEDLERTRGAVNAIDEKLSDIPGDGLLEKVECLLLQNQALQGTQEDARNQEMIVQTLHADLANATNRINYLEQIFSEQDEEYAKRQVGVGNLLVNDLQVGVGNLVNDLAGYLVDLGDGDEEK